MIWYLLMLIIGLIEAIVINHIEERNDISFARLMIMLGLAIILGFIILSVIMVIVAVMEVMM